MGYRSENVGIESPVTKYIEWKSNDKAFSYYDKETEERVEVKMPLKFIALDDMLGVSGGEMDSEGVFRPVRSGIVAHLKKVMVVKQGDKTIATGTWADVKEKVKAVGGRYTVYTYAVLDGELVCFKFAGAALAAWFEKKGNGAKITVKKVEEKKKGGIKYNSPVFETAELSDKDVEKLEASDELKKFDEYAAAKKEQRHDPDQAEDEPEYKPPIKQPKPNLSDDEIEDELDKIDDTDF